MVGCTMLDRIIDVSHHQGVIDWDRVVADRVPMAWCKCIDGRDDIDPRFHANWAAMVERHDQLVIGSYAFARPASDGGGAADGKAEAEDYARVMLATSPPPNWVAVLDLEGGGMDPAHSVQQNVDFVAAWERVCVDDLGRSPMLYTGTNTWRKHMGWTRAFTHLLLIDADYSSSPDAMPWPRTMLQYTSTGQVDGVSGNVDMSRFDGDLEQLRDLEVPSIRPRITGPVMRMLDLAGSGPYDVDVDVARAQGLMLALGQPPDGLLGDDGRPDGRRGPKTLAAWQDLSGAQATVVDWRLLLA